MNLNNNIQPTPDLSDLTHRLKNADKRYGNLSKGIQVLYWVLTPMYVLLGVLDVINGADLKEIIGMACYVVAMLTMAIFFRNYYKDYSFVDYSQPTLIMLKKAAYRYQPFNGKSLWVFVGVIFIDAGISFTSKFDFSWVYLQIGFWSTMIIAVIIGLIIWKIRYKAIRDDALLLIKELEE